MQTDRIWMIAPTSLNIFFLSFFECEISNTHQTLQSEQWEKCLSLTSPTNNKLWKRFDLKNKPFGWLMVLSMSKRSTKHEKKLTFFLSFGYCLMQVAQWIETPLIFNFVCFFYSWVHLGYHFDKPCDSFSFHCGLWMAMNCKNVERKWILYN